MTEELMSRRELEEYVLAVFDIRKDVNAIRQLLEEDDGEAPKEDA